MIASAHSKAKMCEFFEPIYPLGNRSVVGECAPQAGFWTARSLAIIRPQETLQPLPGTWKKIRLANCRTVKVVGGTAKIGMPVQEAGGSFCGAGQAGPAQV